MEGIWPQKGVKGKDTKYMYLKKINSHNMIKLDNYFKRDWAKSNWIILRFWETAHLPLSFLSQHYSLSKN